MTSDISKVFESDDIFPYSENITALSGRGYEQKNGYCLLGSEFSLLIVNLNLGSPNFLSFNITKLECGMGRIRLATTQSKRPQLINIDYSDSQLPSSEEYLYSAVDYPMEDYASDF